MKHLDAVARTWALLALLGWIVLVAFAIGAVGTAEGATVGTGSGERSPEGAGSVEQRRDAPQTTVDEVSSTVMCPSCDTTLDQSDSPAAQRMRAWVREAVEAGWTEQEIRDGLVAEYGGDESVLATPRAEGLGLAAWVVPAVVALVALLGGAVLLRRWRSTPHDRVAGSSTSSSQPSTSMGAPSQSSSKDADDPSSSA